MTQRDPQGSATCRQTTSLLISSAFGSSFLLSISYLLIQLCLAQARGLSSSLILPVDSSANPSYYVADVPSQAITTTTTTTLSPTSSIEDPSNSATSESAEDDSEDCYSCYDYVKVAQTMIAVQMDLSEKQARLIRQRNGASSSSVSSSFSSLTKPSSSSASRPRLPKGIRSQLHKENSTNQSNNNNSRSRATTANLDAVTNKPIVIISTLRVARSADWNEQHDSDNPSSDVLTMNQRNYPHTTNNNNSITRNRSKPNRDPILKQLKHKQEKQLNETCKSVRELQLCLKGISRECLGDLQYHSQDVYADQLFKKLNCAFLSSPTKPFSGLIETRTLPSDFEKIPVPRPISSQEAIQSRLNEMFKGRGMGHFGVMLKPNLTPSASLRFNSLMKQGDAYDSQIHGGSQLVNIIPDYGSTKQLESQLAGMSGQLLLAPCFIVLTIVAVGMIGHYINRSRLIKVES